MSKKTRDLICIHCGAEIECREDLIIAFDILALVPFHYECYSEMLKGKGAFFVGNEPINSVSYNVMAVIMSIIGLYMMFFVNSPWWFSLVLFSGALVRGYAWFKLERYVE